MKQEDGPRLVQLAAHCLGENDLEGAESAALLATHADPRCFEAWVALGVARARAEEHGDAANAFRQALELQPNDVACWTDLGECYVSLMRYDAAAAALRQAMLLDPDAKHPAGRRARAVAGTTMAKLRKAP